MKQKLGLKEGDVEQKKIKMIINTCMNPWLSSQKTFNRISIIVRNELYNAYGAVTDQPEQLSFVSPCSLENYKDWLQDGFIFAELEASFSRVRQGRQYHAVGLFCVREEDRAKILEIAHKARAETLRTNKSKVSGITYLPLRLKTVSEMTVFDLMTGSAAEQEDIKPARSKSTKYGKVWVFPCYTIEYYMYVRIRCKFDV